MQPQITINLSNLILVEGADEENFFNAFVSKNNLTGIQVIKLCGKTNIPAYIKLLPNVPGFNQVKKIAIFRDTDNENQDDIFRSLCDALQRANLPCPDRLFTYTLSTPTVGIFLFPGSGTNGMLEDLCLSSLKEEKILSCMETYFRCCNHVPKKLSKAKILLFLAVHDDIVNSLGLAAQKNYWDFNHSCFDEIKEFLKIFN
jgi:hypothetical protein